MSKEIFNCQLQAQDTARILGVTDQTMIDLICNRLEIAYMNGQLDYIKDMQRKLVDNKIMVETR